MAIHREVVSCLGERAPGDEESSVYSMVLGSCIVGKGASVYGWCCSGKAHGISCGKAVKLHIRLHWYKPVEKPKPRKCEMCIALVASIYSDS